MDNIDEIEICQNVEPHKDDENSVKSKAVVRYAVVQVPAKFTRLQCNTDLNLPPPNWLSNSPNAYGLHQSLYHSPGFASFRMAHMFPDCLGDVDVVSDAENIKRLLKLPYAPKSPISMMVHKVGNALLIDEFDIQKYLLRRADDDWKWLRTFILENILSSLSDKDKNFCLKDKSRRALQRKNLLSKFLYHSLRQTSENIQSTTNTKNNDNCGNEKSNFRPLLLTGPILPEPNMEENVPDPNHTNHVFNRNVVWTFEDIRMLIGTDMPIFGGGTRPCISLRLRDMTKPINVLTGIDYWLDNLMCNVPEVVMCYHLDGIVQKYELVKTEDLPYLEDSKFSPQVIRNVAQNILAFLKANATKAGHTYWLFKGKNDDVVKLYDLTTLCKNRSNCNATDNVNDDNDDDDDDDGVDNDGKHENPFTVPVAMLLYTVARNMKNSTEKITRKKAGSIKILLENCIKLLSKEKFPQIVTSSHYILSDLYIPAGTDPKSPNFDNIEDVDDSDTQSVYDEDYNTDLEYDLSVNENTNNSNDNNDDISDNIAVKNICDTLKEFNGEENWQNQKNNRSPSPLIATIDERCKISLQHISEGIDCLQYFTKEQEQQQQQQQQEINTKVENILKNELNEKEQEKRRIIYEEQHPNMTKPFQPIPLPYEKLKPDSKDDHNAENVISMKQQNKKNKNNKSEKNEDENKKDTNNRGGDLITRDNTQKFGTWNIHLKLLLLEKAYLTYTTLAEHHFNLENYGISLKAIYMALKCQKIILQYMVSMKSQKCCLYAKAGDCYFQIVKNWQNVNLYIEQFKNMSNDDKMILNQIEKDVPKENLDEFPDLSDNIEFLMVMSCKFYEIALEMTDSYQSRNEILRRLGSVRNELGLKYMYWAQEEYTKYMSIKRDNNGDDNDKKGEIKEMQSECKNENDSEQKEGKKEPLYQILAKKSYDSLIQGIAAFEKSNDTVNLALLLCNMGRFMRFRAHIHLKGEKVDDVRLQKKFYNSAFTYYERALNILDTRKKNPELWDLVNWELSTAVFNLAKQVQDFSDKNDTSSEEVEREIVNLLQKSLKLCDVAHPGSRQVVYTYRQGLIHSRLGSLHHSQLRKAKLNDDLSLKTTLQLCRIHYEKASKILENLKEIKDFLTIQLERIALQEFLAENSNGNQKIKSLQIALDICIQTKSIFDHIRENGLENVSSIEEISKLLKLFENRLQFILRSLAKLCSTKIKNSKELLKAANDYKSMYSLTLGTLKINDEQKFAEHLLEILEKISKFNIQSK